MLLAKCKLGPKADNCRCVCVCLSICPTKVHLHWTYYVHYTNTERIYVQTHSRMTWEFHVYVGQLKLPVTCIVYRNSDSIYCIWDQSLIIVINARRACAQGLQYFVRLFVCLSVRLLPVSWFLFTFIWQIRHTCLFFASFSRFPTNRFR